MKADALHRLLRFHWLARWWQPDIEFITPLSIEECQNRLAKALSFERRFWGPVSKNPVIGWVRSGHFRMYKPAWFRTEFSPFLSGDLIAVPQGTAVRAAFWGDRIITIIMWILFLGWGLLALCNGLSGDFPWWWDLVTVALFWALAGLIMWLPWQLGKSRRRYVINYLCRALLQPHAHE
jgi:hypothetical protein